MNHNSQNARYKITSEFIYCDFDDQCKYDAESAIVKIAMRQI